MSLSEERQSGIEVIVKLGIQTGTTVLDLGCGTDYLTKVLSEQVGPEGKVVAVDPDGEKLKIAREKYSADNIKFIQADNKTFPSGEYDIIFSNYVLHWIHNKEAFLNRVHSNLRPGGLFSFTTYDGVPEYPPVVAKLFNLMGPNYYQNVFFKKLMYLSASEYWKLVSAFTVVSFDTECRMTEWKNLDDFICCTHQVLQEMFDPTNIDDNELNKLKEEHGYNTTIRRRSVLIKAILVKEIPH